MKKKYLMATTLMAGLALSSTAFAADGIIHFTGRVVDNVCNVSPTLNVMMGDITADQLGNIGSSSAEKKFELVLTDCPASLNGAYVKLDGTRDDKDPTVFQLDNSGQPGNASGIGLQIKDETSVIEPGAISQSWPLDPLATSNTLPFSATYKVTDKITTGDANVSVQFSILYN
ncbi:hypothetical protein Z042_10575 [Chania multitudinisentens RB-25]|uniref:Fimbrial-type adhesion domain-containing protein n=1 Tax=Chania multitudinisentens RB-25 TaxID=1441930 RepID=W0LG70_9GAMM|nr:fimbrial protein [Chania multitudinisentens]AHG22741.1 hypothetical protein Z042_10575 [Chania multitudinisentens RB-25]